MAIFTKRRFRDRWNRTVVRRIAKTHNHTLKVKGRVRARGERGRQWYSDSHSEIIRRRVRTQALWLRSYNSASGVAVAGGASSECVSVELFLRLGLRAFLCLALGTKEIASRGRLAS